MRFTFSRKRGLKPVPLVGCAEIVGSGAQLRDLRAHADAHVVSGRFIDVVEHQLTGLIAIRVLYGAVDARKNA